MEPKGVVMVSGMRPLNWVRAGLVLGVVSVLLTSIASPLTGSATADETVTPVSTTSTAQQATSVTMVTTEFVARREPSQPPRAPKRKSVERHLNKLGLPVGTVDGNFDAYTQRGFCAWRELTGRKISRNYPTEMQRFDIMATTELRVPKSMIVGLNVNQTCQVNTWVVKPKNRPAKIRAVFPVSTGRSSFTPNGSFTMQRQTNAWHESTLFEGAMMYRPKYVVGGIAMHGSASDSMVLPYPASAGCIRMLHKDMDTLWDNNVNPGTRVRIYGSF